MAKKFTNSGQFKKGQKSWSFLNKGKYKLGPCSEETKIKIALANSKPKVIKSCNHCSVDIVMWPSKIGTKKFCSRKCANDSRKGKPSWNTGMVGFGAGENHHWYGTNKTGENSPAYKKDRSTLAKRQLRNDSSYHEWRKQVWLRDNFTCKIANPDCKGRLEAHHILPWRDYAELRYQVNNGITLCHFHHPRARKEEKRLSPYFQELVSVSK